MLRGKEMLIDEMEYWMRKWNETKCEIIDDDDAQAVLR